MPNVNVFLGNMDGRRYILTAVRLTVVDDSKKFGKYVIVGSVRRIFRTLNYTEVIFISLFQNGILDLEFRTDVV